MWAGRICMSRLGVVIESSVICRSWLGSVFHKICRYPCSQFVESVNWILG